MPKKKTYDPHGWNDYPQITPPEGVVMCLEVTRHTFSSLLYPSREGRRFIAVWKPVTLPAKDSKGFFTRKITENRWVGEHDALIETYGELTTEKVFKARFRPWNLE